MLGGNQEQIVSALSNAWTDGGALRIYRHAPNTGPRKSWAAGDATSRGGAPGAHGDARRDGLSVGADGEDWGFYDVLFKGKPFTLGRAVRLLCHGERAVQDLFSR